jgi:hypothetical protein
LDVASNTSNGGTMAPPGSVSTFRRPFDIFSTVSAQSLKIRWKLDAAGCEDWPLRISGFAVVCERAGFCEANKKAAATQANSIAMRLRMS